ncbi:MAG: SH3 domain-containing protein [Anaerolineae bacterium]|nr:SH3 domain-containing protein [Anaerolineae bacterium]
MRRVVIVSGLVMLISLLLASLISGLIIPPTLTYAQDTTTQPATCTAIYQRALVDFMANCFDKPVETVCGAAGQVQIEMVSGQIVESDTATGSGSAARLSGVAAIRALAGDGSAWSLASLTVPDMLDAHKSVTLLILGPAEVVFDTTSSATLGTAFTLNTPDPAPCGDLPHPGVLVQSPENSLTLLTVNGTDIAINGMALIWAREDSSILVSSLTRESILGQTGTVVFAGYMVRALGDAVSEVVPYDAAAVQHIPTEILPVMDVISLPGNATVLQANNIHTRPDPATYTNFLVNAGLPVTILGHNSASDWLLVRTYEGVVGWMPAFSLQVNVPVEMPVYDAIPAAPIRPFGSVQTYVKTKEEHNNLRAGPGEDFDIVATVPLWSDLALYGRSPDDEWLLVETLDGVRGWVSVWLISTSTPYTMSELPYPPDLGR